MRTTRNRATLFLLLVFLAIQSSHAAGEEKKSCFIQLNAEFRKVEYWNGQVTNEEIDFKGHSLGDLGKEGEFSVSEDSNSVEYRLEYINLDKQFNIERKLDITVGLSKDPVWCQAGIDNLKYEYTEDDQDPDDVYKFKTTFNLDGRSFDCESLSSTSHRCKLDLSEGLCQLVKFEQEIIRNESFSSIEKLHSCPQGSEIIVELKLGQEWPDNIPWLFTSPTYVIFPPTEPGESVAETITVENRGCGDAEITRITLTGRDSTQFRLVGAGACEIVSHGDPCKFDVLYEPTRDGFPIAKIEIYWDAPPNRENPVTVGLFRESPPNTNSLPAILQLLLY